MFKGMDANVKLIVKTLQKTSVVLLFQYISMEHTPMKEVPVWQLFGFIVEKAVFVGRFIFWTQNSLHISWFHQD